MNWMLIVNFIAGFIAFAYHVYSKFLEAKKNGKGNTEEYTFKSYLENNTKRIAISGVSYILVCIAFYLNKDGANLPEWAVNFLNGLELAGPFSWVTLGYFSDSIVRNLSKQLKLPDFIKNWLEIDDTAKKDEENK